jgi:acyl carrier protein
MPDMSPTPDPAVLPGLAQTIHRVTGRPVADVRPERTFIEDLRIDSIAMVEILEGTAVHFGVRIDDEDAKDFVAVQDLVTYLEARV